MEPSLDDIIGMAWWNALDERERRFWMREAGDTGRAVDAWRAYKKARAYPLALIDRGSIVFHSVPIRATIGP
jgi:hypothetical protein